MGAFVETTLSEADRGFLDRLFEDVVARLEEGAAVELDVLLAGREQLRDRAADLVELARTVAVGAESDGAFPRVPGYTILAEAGRGGMGAVYVARQDAVAGRRVALKVLPRGVSLSPRARERFRAEIAAVARLRHEHVVAVHDVVHAGDLHAYAMEWVEGATLGQVIEHVARHASLAADTSGSTVRSPSADHSAMRAVRELLGGPEGAPPEATYTQYVCRVGQKIALALAAVHAQGLLHRDVKPSNILIRRDGTPLLSDFGLVRDERGPTITQSDHFVGTPAYSSPEQLGGKSRAASSGDASATRSEAVDARSDVYSLGVTLYHALALALPFRGRTHGDIQHQIAFGIVPPLRKLSPRVPTDVETVVAKAMDVDPDRRYATAGEMADDLRRVLELRPIRARPASAIQRATKLLRRNRAAFAGFVGGGVIAAALLVGLGIYIVWVPRWIARDVEAARLSLLDPGRTRGMHNLLFWGQAQPGVPGGSPAALADALGHYDAALRWRPWNRSLRRERDVAAYALDVGDGAAEAPASLKADAPRTVEFMRSWLREGVPRSPLGQRGDAAVSGLDSRLWPAPTGALGTSGGDDAAEISSEDLRCLALLAYLTGDMDTAAAAWVVVDLREPGDPIVDTALGFAYLIDEQPARAYPRLQRAAAEFPRCGWITTALADAAGQCGDVRRAELALERARSLPQSDPQAMLRVGIMTDLAAGRVEVARSRYHAAARTGFSMYSCVLGCQYAQWMEAHGHLDEAMRAYVRAYGQGGFPRAQRVRRHMERCAAAWWDSLTTRERLRVLRASLDNTGLDEFNPAHVLFQLARDGMDQPLDSHSDAGLAGPTALGRRFTLGALVRLRSWIETLPPGAKDVLTLALLTPLHRQAADAAAAIGGVREGLRSASIRALPRRWKAIPAVGAPAVRSPAVASGGGWTILHGGKGAAGVSDRTWMWDGERWSPREAPGPAARRGASMAYDASRGRFLLMGGFDARDRSLKDAWTFDGSVWTQLCSVINADSMGSVLVQHPVRPVLMHVHSWSSLAYVEVGEADPSIVGRPYVPGIITPSVESAVFDSRRGRVVVVGGAVSPHAPVGVDQTVEFDGDHFSLPKTIGSPGPRIASLLVYDPDRGRTVLFGGVRSECPPTPLHDTWEYDGAAWVRTDTEGPGAPADARMFYDGVKKRVLLMGCSPGEPSTWKSGMWEYEPPPVNPGR